MTTGRVGPLASLLVTLGTTLIPLDQGGPLWLVKAGMIAWAGVSLIDALAARLDLGWPAIYFCLTALIAGLSFFEYSACLWSWQGPASGLAYVSAEMAFLLTAIQVSIRYLCDLIGDEFGAEDDWPYDHDDEEWGEDGDG